MRIITKDVYVMLMKQVFCEKRKDACDTEGRVRYAKDACVTQNTRVLRERRVRDAKDACVTRKTLSLRKDALT